MKTNLKIGNVRVEIFAIIKDCPALMLASDPKESHDAKLLDLTIGLGHLAQAVNDNSTGRANRMLVSIAAHCAGWLHSLGCNEGFAMINDERERQKRMLANHPDKYPVILDSNIADSKRKLRVLIKEIGVTAETIGMLENCRTNATPALEAELIAELVQVAAGAVAWLETPEVKS